MELDDINSQMLSNNAVRTSVDKQTAALLTQAQHRSAYAANLDENASDHVKNKNALRSFQGGATRKIPIGEIIKKANVQR